MFTNHDRKLIEQTRALDLLEWLMKERIAKGYDTLLMEEVNYVLLVGRGEVLTPVKKEVKR